MQTAVYSKHTWIVTNYYRYSQATPILEELHWLPVEFWCIFKTATLVYNFHHPSYFSPHLSICCGRYGTRYNHRVFSKLPLWFISFFTQAISPLICLFVVEDMTQDTTAHMKGSWRFPNTTHLYTNKKTLQSQFCF